MNFYTRTLWKQINSQNEYERVRANEQWERNSEAYSAYIKSLNNPVLTKFNNILNRYQGFHDYIVDSVLYNKESQKIMMVMHLNRRKTRLLFRGVEAIETNCGDICRALNGETFGYFELELLHGNKISISIAFDFEKVGYSKVEYPTSLLYYFKGKLLIKNIQNLY